MDHIKKFFTNLFVELIIAGIIATGGYFFYNNKKQEPVEKIVVEVKAPVAAPATVAVPKVEPTPAPVAKEPVKHHKEVAHPVKKKAPVAATSSAPVAQKPATDDEDARILRDMAQGK